MAYQITLGSYVFPESLSLFSDTRIGTTPNSPLPRAHGSAMLPRVLSGRRLAFRGMFAAGQSGYTNAPREALDALFGALLPQEQTLTIDSDSSSSQDRLYRRVQPDGQPIVSWDENGWNDWCRVTFELLSADPCVYAAAASSDNTWSSPLTGATHVVTNGAGDFPALPIVTVNLAGTGTVGIGLENQTASAAKGYSQTFSLQGAASQTTIHVDCLKGLCGAPGDLPVTYGDGTDAIGLFDGQFPELETGANTWQITITGGTVAVASVGFTWNSRWK